MSLKQFIFPHYLFFTLIAFQLSITLYAQDYSSNNPQNILTRSIKKTTEEHVERDDAIISESAENVGGYESLYDTNADRYRYSLSIHGNHNPTTLTKFLGLEISQATKQEIGWREIFASASMVNLTTISNAFNFSNLNSSDLLFSAGLGLTYRFKLLQNIIQSNSMFENVSAYLAGHYLTDSFEKKIYWGPGIKTDYTILKRTSSTYHFGVKFSYNIASMFGEKNSGLTISWLSAALDFGIYF